MDCEMVPQREHQLQSESKHRVGYARLHMHYQYDLLCQAHQLLDDILSYRRQDQENELLVQYQSMLRYGRPIIIHILDQLQFGGYIKLIGKAA